MPDKACGIVGIEEKMTWYTARGMFISSEPDAGTSITHVAEMAGNSARTIEKYCCKNTKQAELRRRMNVWNGSWGQHVGWVYDRSVEANGRYCSLVCSFR